ncbi:uncharacterized protein si:dkeyp-72g9.4 [Pungitius pungitius]|uniref:uncharacterized protein si:dkeyp-72g9.4 n=1 Tax=Pungitius pungitius TaxID=134920 RepID=UPI002E0FA144
MRPRSRRRSKRALVLPTIREGAEESLRDLNEANVLHAAGHGQAVSSEDYLLSICHLASPTFPARHTSPDSPHPLQRLARLGDSTSQASGTRQAEEIHLNGEPVFGNCDPLEYLYGHQEAPSGGVRGAFVPPTPELPRQRKSSCPELASGTDTCVPSPSPRHSASPWETRRENPEQEGGGRQSPAIKPSLIAQWLSDCRSAWREARVRARMLPAIAEM